MSNGSSEFAASASLDSGSLNARSAALYPSAERAGTVPLTLRIVRGPLEALENESILSQYNRLTGSNIPPQDFLRWIQDSPEGPAWHALLETSQGEIVGHTSLIPFRGAYRGRSFVAAKSEYSFIREEFRTAKIRGFEQTGRLKNLIYIDELFRSRRAAGWSPLLISTPEHFHRVFRSIRCYPVRFPLWECLLILRPHKAGRHTPNLQGWQRAVLWSAGLLQSAWWTASVLASGNATKLRKIGLDEQLSSSSDSALSFFQDRDFLAWRYPAIDYERIVADPKNGGDVIVKRGTADRFLRVCQWSLNAPPTRTLVAALVQKASEQRALGVRWAVYGDEHTSGSLVRSLRRFGFLCVRRVRTLLINSADERFLEASSWNLMDSMFSFDL